MVRYVASFRYLVCLALAAGSASACHIDEPATYVPKPGTWSYAEQSVVSNSCSDQLGMPDPMSMFLLDYDGGDSFQIEEGANDVMCEIDGVDFTCNSYLVATVDMPGGFPVTLEFRVKYSGQFASETAASGNAVSTVTCIGDQCATLLPTLPCTRNVTFDAEFVM